MNEFMQRPSRPSGGAPASEPAKTSAASVSNKSKKIGMHKGFQAASGLLVLCVAVIALALIALLVTNSQSAVGKENDRVLDDTYQAVFLNDPNGQVYFGNLEVLNGDQYRLSDIYYVQVQTAIQPDTGERTTSGISLAKLGNELHGPLDTMYINRDHVLFWENLKTDGQVVCAISDYQINELELDVEKDAGCDEREQQTQQQTGGTTDNSTGAVQGSTQPVGTDQQDDTAGADEVPTTTP